MRNPFETITANDRKKSAVVLERISDEYNGTILAARECFKNEQFKAYREKCNQTTRVLFGLLLDTPSTDVLTESIRIKINAMRLLGIDVLSLANLELRQPKQEEKKNASS